MNYIISGGLGFIGKNLTLALDRANKNFMVLDKITGCDLNSCKIRVSNCDTFVHLAACTNIRESLIYPEKFIIENVQTTTRCLNYARQVGAHFIFASSMGAPQSLSPYSASKLACESICNAYCESFDVDVTILRFSSVYGPNSINKSSVVATFIKNCIENKPLTIIGDGLQVRDFVYVEDVVNAIINCAGIRRLNVCTGEYTSIVTIASIIAELSENILNRRPEICFVDPVKGEISDFQDSPPSIGISPQISLEDCLERTFKWYLAHYKP